MDKKSAVDFDLIRHIAENLSGAFVWQNTDEGREYWVKVMAALVRISEKGH